MMKRVGSAVGTWSAVIETPASDAELELGGGDEELDGLLRGEQLHHAPDGSEPQIVRFAEHAHQPSDLLVQIIGACVHQLARAVLPLRELLRYRIFLPHLRSFFF